MVPPRRSELETKFGRIVREPTTGKLTWMRAWQHLENLFVPAEIAAVCINAATNKGTTKIFCNLAMHEPLREVFGALIGAGLHLELKTFDGCFNVRPVRGVPNVMSVHSWGLALDFNAKDNPLGGESTWSPDFVQVWKDAGFVWGGDFKRKDPMHFQYCIEDGK